MKHQVGDIYVLHDETFIKVQDKNTGKTRTQTYYRYLVEQYIGFPIPEGYIVHHIDWNHKNNSLSNFFIVKSKLHVWIHRCGEKNIVSNLDLWKKTGAPV